MAVLGLLILVIVGAMDQPEWQYARDVSLVELIVDPAKYDGKKIEVSGYLRAEDSIPRLYLTREDAYMRNSGSAVFVNLEYDDAIKCSDKFVMVAGEAGVIPSLGVASIPVVWGVFVHSMESDTHGFDSCYLPAEE